MMFLRLLRCLLWLAPPPRGRHAYARRTHTPNNPPAPAPSRPRPSLLPPGPADTAPVPVATDATRRLIGPWYVAWERGRTDALDTVRAELGPLVRELASMQAGGAR